MAGLKKKYTKDNLTVIWQPDLCIHSTNCFKGLPHVFNPANKPWVTLDAERIDNIRKQVEKCPSGALSYVLEEEYSEVESDLVGTPIIDVTENGPLLVKGPVNVRYKGKDDLKDSKTVALCRCGGSYNKPYCDGTHRRVGFKD